MELLNYLFCDMFGGILECYELTHVLPYPDTTRQSCMSVWKAIRDSKADASALLIVSR